MDWTEIKLLELIENKIEENLSTEYKAAAALGRDEKKKNEISKDISAMANANGGTIFYGIAEYQEKNKKHLPEKLDPIERKDYTKEWLENVINGNINPKIKGIKITPVEINSDDTKVIFIVEVPKSNTAHQAGDFRYYQRRNFSNSPMYDYEVMDVKNRTQHPVIDLTFEIVLLLKSNSVNLNQGFNLKDVIGNKKYTEIEFNVYANNLGSIYAKYVNYFLKIPSNIVKNKEFFSAEYEMVFENQNSYLLITGDNTRRDLLDHQPALVGRGKSVFGATWFHPILPQLGFKIQSFLLNDNVKFGDQEIVWTVFADNASKREGKIQLKDIEMKSKYV